MSRRHRGGGQGRGLSLLYVDWQLQEEGEAASIWGGVGRLRQA